MAFSDFKALLKWASAGFCWDVVEDTGEEVQLTQLICFSSKQQINGDFKTDQVRDPYLFEVHRLENSGRCIIDPGLYFVGST